MGQIFDRLGRLIKSELQSDTDFTFANLSSEDDELLKSFEELEKNKNFDNFKNSNNANSSNSQPNSKVDAAFAYATLGISSQATNEEIKAAYLKNIKEYHPDKVASLGVELKKLAEKKTQDINSAYNFLKTLRGF